ncbi:MAG: hypothetical protein AAF591_10990 [Verrucomicrobiota bacterium]
MADQANISSIENIELFRTSLVVYLDKAGIALDEITDEVKRTREWIENDQRSLWTSNLRRRQRAHDQAQQDLYSARLSGMHDASAAQLQAVRRTKAALEEAEHKLRAIAKWSRDFDGLVGPLVKKVESLRFLITHDMGKAVSYLSQITDTLAEYAELSSPSAKSSSKSKSANTSSPSNSNPADS